MSNSDAIRQLLLRAQRDSAHEMELIQGQQPLNRAFLHEHLVQYVLDKYMLTSDDCATDNFDQLTDLSLAKSMQMSTSLVREYDIARSCSGTSSAMAKRVLLFLSIQRALDIELPAIEASEIVTLSDLTQLVWQTMLRTPGWAGRLAR